MIKVGSVATRRAMIDLQQTFFRTGYSENKLKAICKNVRHISTEELLTYRREDKSCRVTII